jgi:hypothetical protein
LAAAGVAGFLVLMALTVVLAAEVLQEMPVLERLG